MCRHLQPPESAARACWSRLVGAVRILGGGGQTRSGSAVEAESQARVGPGWGAERGPRRKRRPRDRRDPGEAPPGAAPHVGVAPLGDLGRGAPLRRDRDPRGSHGPVIHTARPGHWLRLCFVGPQPARPAELRTQLSSRTQLLPRPFCGQDTRAPPGAPVLRGGGRVPD